MTPAQLVLPMADPDRMLLASVRVRAEVRAVAKDLGFKRVADLLGIGDGGEGLVSQKLEERERRSLKPHELMAIMGADTHGRILAVICAELGYEMPVKKPPSGDDVARYEAALSELFGPEIVELVRLKAAVANR